MGLIKNILKQHQRNVEERNNKCNELINEIDNSINDSKNIFISNTEFIDPLVEEEWKERNHSTIDKVNIENIKTLKKASQYKTLLSKQTDLLNITNSLYNNILKHNETIASAKVEEAYSIIGDVEGRKLDYQQMISIVKESHNHLVVAGAGTGKTTTLVGKIKYLLKTNKYKPQDILVLSFTNASATEMKERINKETNENIAAATFHKLGLYIITQVEDVKPKITQLNLKSFIKEQLKINMKNEEYLKLLTSYLLYNRVINKDEFEFKTEEEYKEYLKLNPPTTLNNEIVKSYGEMDIANFLIQNNIKYIYEHPYIVDTRDDQYGQYYPDFYLPDYNIYIEYFGINKNGEVPSYFSSRNGMSATQAYQESMKWKRNIHKDNNTTMIECYAYEKFDGVLLDELKNKLNDLSINLCPKSSIDLWNELIKEDNSILEGIIELFETLINLIKSNGYNIEDVKRINVDNKYVKTNNGLIVLLEPIFNAYNQTLKSNQEIDFNDMINLATLYVKQGKYINTFSYIIIDEYQDISKARFNLLKELRNSKDYDLFCVGDDWQSIYRFAGSDIGYILNFSKYWGLAEISKIETTYRFSQKLIEISGNFVMRNPMQIKKYIKGNTDDSRFPLGEISGFNDKYSIEFLSKRLNDLPANSSVYFIGRYAFDVNLLDHNPSFHYQYNNITGFIDIKYKNRLDLNIKFLTVHKSKGLQADYVFILNNKKSRTGFPSKIHEAPILNLLLDNCDHFTFAEERRLFYVALTRAKIKTYLVTVNNKESEFVLELKRKYKDELKKENFECPVCGGKLIKKSGPYGEFFGCSNYKTTGCKYIRKIG